MPLSSLFKRKAALPPAADAAGDESSEVLEARTRARRRLIGAALLLAVGVVGFPLLFETEPRPLSPDLAIETARKDSAARPAAARPRAPAGTEVAAAHSAAAAKTHEAKVAEAKPADAPAAEKPAEVKPAEARTAETKSAEAKSAEGRPIEAKATPEPKRAETKPADAATAEAKPVAENRPRESAAAASAAAAAASDARNGRFVVQVGAYTDPATLQTVRAKVEKLGLKTYTQTIETDAGKRTRVRVGPYVTREEADTASAKLKAAGLPGNVLIL